MNNDDRGQSRKWLPFLCIWYDLTFGNWKSRAEESGYDYSPAVIQSRFFTYTTDIPALCEKFRNNLEAVLETIPEIVDTECKESVRAYVARKEPNLEAEIQKYEALVEDRQKYVELLKDIQDSDLERTAENDNKKREIKDLIHSLNGESLNECTKYCTSVLTVDEITRRIKSKGIKNKKEDIQQFASQLQDEMQSKCSDLLKERSEQLSVKVKEYVSDYQEGVQASFQEANLNADFDAGYAFASSLAKIGIIGGLGAFLAADAAFAFGSWAFLFGIGGQIALFANFLGPIGIVAGALISAGLGIMKLFGGGWEKSVAKKLVNAYEEKGVTDQYRKAINEYWAQTETAFDQAAEQLDQAWTAYAIEGVLSNAGLEITANISKMCTMGTVGAITVAVFSTVQFVKLIYRGECLKSAAIQVGKQALFSLSLLAISIAAQGMWGGPAGIIVSIGTGIVIVSYTIADAVHQRTFAEECHIKTIEEYGRLALRHLNELQFA